MNYRLTAADQSAPARVGASAWWRSRLPEELGACFTDRLSFDDGLALVYAHYQPVHDLRESSAIERSRSLTVTVALEGRSSTQSVDGQRFDFLAGHSTMAAFANVRSERHFPAGRPARQLRLIAEEPLLHRYGLAGLLDGVRDDQSARHLFFGKHGAAIRRLADSLVHLHDHAGGLLDMQIAALGLLAEHARPFAPPVATAGKIRSSDQDRILRARDILASQFDRQLTVAYLCATVGTNEFALKQGFRALFGTSPHRMLTGIRMEKAWELLETGLHVSTVAYRVGYQHLSSFSAAFERHYGRTPKSVAGTRKRR
ncbi:helix-turn-helix transcriptional regulator [Alicycliphilus denitrificans]|jgi:AraC-like DNA-binding protein|uniref:helix-turn-helix transcriptional regulator n=1 Tax=Alicycliphilus denitrificans TaxID=179636 RepID=UPI003A813441